MKEFKSQLMAYEAKMAIKDINRQRKSKPNSK